MDTATVQRTAKKAARAVATAAAAEVKTQVIVKALAARRTVIRRADAQVVATAAEVTANANSKDMTAISHKHRATLYVDATQ